MTTKPKARKFRIRRNPQAGADDGADAPTTDAASEAAPAAPTEAPEPAAEPKADAAPETNVTKELTAIRSEGLTGRQLRMARRVAQKHNLPAVSDYDAVRLLRNKGIDPFKRSNMLELVVPKAGSGSGKDATGGSDDPRIQLPQTVSDSDRNLPAAGLSPAQRRELEIGKIQRDIVRRRRRKLALLMARLFAFVMLPTAIVGWYFYVLATPMYASKSEFVILQADGTLGGVGSFFAGTQFATSQDSISVQSFLESKEAMLLLDRDEGFMEHFSQPHIDPIQRLDPQATNEDAYNTYSKMVTIGYDPTEGVIRMEVAAAEPETAAEFSEALISYAEGRVNNLSEQKREDQMDEARAVFETAQAERRKAQEELVELQLQGEVLDPEGVIASLRSRINQVEVQIQEKELQLAALLDNPRPNQAKVDGTRADIERLQSLLASLNAQMIDASKGENSLAQLTVNIQMAQADLATRDIMLQSALQQMETTRMEANRQVRYLTVSVNPVPSQEPTYPRKFENTIVAFLIFAGIYLMISLTASILREQVSS
ncbi:capsular polysaccharide transport system permease protein [Cribrihabitans marinus]|uniref:Capsular polysaccharide transport system permease protein n=1 Tax=Cribrihabitans marinus TaxID=1227549 RepID=A0A1H6T3E0_9RHOB|nr:capsule biosynthesis protein [Cribrihabitans marinus]GGH22923.1 capsule polysaccharide transporter [Cribrihabitans marinus]SEI70765.1 capsular polysaccharide transport system permease protein [Cribrihabitans marinus]